MSEAQLFALGVLLAWLAGVRVYLTVFSVGLAGLFGWMELPSTLQLASSPWVLGVSGVLAAVEFFTDKIPGVDSVSDLLHTLLRIPAGAFLAAATLAPEGASWSDLSGQMLVIGAASSGSSHLIKSGVRALTNLSPEPISNWILSLMEDFGVIGTFLLALVLPLLALGLVLVVSGVVLLVLLFFARRLWKMRKKRQQAIAQPVL